MTSLAFMLADSRAGSRATITTRAPARARAEAIASPIPELPPVTTATRPASENSSVRNPVVVMRDCLSHPALQDGHGTEAYPPRAYKTDACKNGAYKNGAYKTVAGNTLLITSVLTARAGRRSHSRVPAASGSCRRPRSGRSP